MATARALDHIVLVSFDVERTLAWYERHAGLAVENLEEWREGKASFPSLRIDGSTIVDIIPGDPRARGHLDHLCLVVSAEDQAALAADPELEVVEEGSRGGARGVGHSIYVRDPDGLLVEFKTYDS